MPAWLEAHRDSLEQLSRQSPLADLVVGQLPHSYTEVGFAIGVVAAVVVVVTAAAAHARRPGLALYSYATVLGVLFLHVFTHAGQALLFRGYVPGLVGALIAVLPGSVLIYRRLFSTNILTLKAAALAALVGFALFPPGLLAIFALARAATH